MSISLSAVSINTRSPYPVRTENGFSFLFTTDYGHLYEVGFLEDYTLGDNCNTYQFFISLHDNNHYPRDKKVFDTIVAILEEFFKNELVTLVFICDTFDGRQIYRNRLFSIWFNQYQHKDEYWLETKVLVVEDTQYYFSIIAKRDMPFLHERLESLNQLYTTLEAK